MKKGKFLTAIVIFAAIAALLMSSCAGNGANQKETAGESAKNVIVLSGNSAKLDGNPVKEYDYTWHYDPSCAEPYYTGTEPGNEDVYIAHDIVYYPETDAALFAKENYDGEQEWVTHYTAAGLEDYIFSTLPVLGEDLPTEMMHSAEEAYQNPVLHITKAGEYTLEGSWNGQIWIDLAGDEDCFTEKSHKVTLILNGADIECAVAPAVVFYDVYECDNAWEDRAEAQSSVDITDAGAKVIIADGTENNVTGANVFRLLKPEYKKDSDSVQKKLWKMDGAFYSYESLLIDGDKGTGILNITSTTFEGLDSELHLCINNGYINIVSQDDGINVNEDGVSVFTVNGGHLIIFAGQGAEGDVIDSNGYIDVNGGFIAGTSPSPMDNMLDSDCGTDVSDSAVIVSSTSGSEQGMMPGGMGGPGGFEGMEPPEGMQPPEGFTPGQQPNQGSFDPNTMPKPDAKPQIPQ